MRRVHIKPFSCTLCTKTFGLRSDLDHHTTRHYSHNKFFKCTLAHCESQGFSRKQHLARHIQNAHTIGRWHFDAPALTKLLSQPVAEAKMVQKQRADQLKNAAAFHHASARDDRSTMDTLLSEADVDVNCKDKNGRTAILNAIEKGNAPMVGFLLSRNASLDSTDRNSGALLARAAGQCHAEIVDMLLKHNCKKNLRLKMKLSLRIILGFSERYNI